MSIVPYFWSLTSTSNNRTLLVTCYLKKASTLPYLIDLNLGTSLINISCCRLACKNISNTLRFDFSSEPAANFT